MSFRLPSPISPTYLPYISHASPEVSFRLPFEAMPSFGGLLRELDDRGAELKLG